jgi:Domain of unknown function (DUF5666)
MRRAVARRHGALVGLLAALVIGTVATAAKVAGTPSPLSKGWGWVLAAGTVSGVDPNARTATLAIGGQGRLETFEGGGNWRRQLVTGSQVVHLLPGTVIADGGDEPATLAAIRPGAAATVWGVVRPDASVLGLKVLVTPAVPRQTPASAITTSRPGGVSGAVLRSSGGMLELLSAHGARRSIIVTGATMVRKTSGVVPATMIAPYDVVRVEGAVNADGSIAATRIEVEQEAAAAMQVASPLDQVFGEVEGLVVGGVMVPIPAGCYFIKGSGPGAFKQLTPGQAVIVYGAPITSGTTSVGLRARVVVWR